MKTLTVQEAQPQLGQLIAEAAEGDVIVLTDGTRAVTLQPGAARDLEEDSPELETELLQAIEGPFSPYSSEEMRNLVERLIHEEKLHLMEALWRDPTRNAETFESPEWHREVLEERERRIASGQSHFSDWEQAKADIRNRLA